MRHILLAGAFALACLHPALAQDCKPLQLLGSADLEIHGDSTVVNVTINGTPAKFLLATSGGITRFTPEGAAALGLQSISNSRVMLINSKSKSSESYVVVDDMSVGGAHIAHSQFMIAPGGLTGGDDIVGIMGADLLSHFDVELDFGAGKMNLFSQDHCPGKVIYWKHVAVSVVPLSEFQPTSNDSRTGYQGYMKRFEQMWVPVALDDKSIPAQLSTSSESFMEANTALGAFKVDINTAGSKPLDNPMARPDTFQHKFSQLVFDGVTVTNPTFTVFPLDPAKFARRERRTDTRLARLDDGDRPYVVVGMDVLTKLHLFASFGEHRLFITEASGPPRQASSSAGGAH